MKINKKTNLERELGSCGGNSETKQKKLSIKIFKTILIIKIKIKTKPKTKIKFKIKITIKLQNLKI